MIWDLQVVSGSDTATSWVACLGAWKCFFCQDHRSFRLLSPRYLVDLVNAESVNPWTPDSLLSAKCCAHATWFEWQHVKKLKSVEQRPEPWCMQHVTVCMLHILWSQLRNHKEYFAAKVLKSNASMSLYASEQLQRNKRTNAKKCKYMGCFDNHYKTHRTRVVCYSSAVLLCCMESAVHILIKCFSNDSWYTSPWPSLGETWILCIKKVTTNLGKHHCRPPRILQPPLTAPVRGQTQSLKMTDSKDIKLT